MRHELQIYDGTMREVCGDLVQFRPALRGEPATEAPERKGMRGRPKAFIAITQRKEIEMAIDADDGPVPGFDACGNELEDLFF